MLNLRFYLFSLFLALAGTLGADDFEKGKLLYQQNCMACHQLDKMVVGPSLVEIAHIYKDHQKGVVEWSMKPGKKRPEAIAMPPMAHVGKEGLEAITAYIFKVTKGKRFQRKRIQTDPWADVPVPKVMRTFMPDAGPAAIAVSMNENLHFCWDAGTCQLRYIWKGDFIDVWPVMKGNGHGLANIKGDVFVKMNQGSPFQKAREIKFKGYRRVDGKPIFKYTIDGQCVEVSFEVDQQHELTLNFSGEFDQKVIYAPKMEKGEWSSKQGKKSKEGLQLSSKEAKAFSVTFKAGGAS